jgi:hypothetical protein
LPLLPWLRFVLSPEARQVSHAAQLSFKFFPDALRHAWGLGLEYSLQRDYRALLQGPELAGLSTHLAQAARYGLLLLLVWGVLTQLRRALQHKSLRAPEPIATYALCVALAGAMLIAARIQVYPHYQIVFGPMLHLTAAWLLYTRRAAVFLLCALQGFITLCFLVFVHTHGGAPHADYGKSYRAQSAEERNLPAP